MQMNNYAKSYNGVQYLFHLDGQLKNYLTFKRDRENIILLMIKKQVHSLSLVVIDGETR